MALVELQHRLGAEVQVILASDPWLLPARPLVAGCFVAFATGAAGPGQPGDRAWAAAVVWEASPSSEAMPRSVDDHLRGRSRQWPRRADDIVAQSVVSARVPAAYRPGLLALREGTILADAIEALDVRPDVVLVDASGVDHPRRAGLAVQLGAFTRLPTVGVTQRSLLATGTWPDLRRGASSPVAVEGRPVGYWVCTRTGARPVLAHAAWRTSAETASATVLAASTEAARTPVPLQDARRVAREARTRAEAAG
ncbi:MAG: endonuclease V [Actinomycetota bacterium]|nr:endonuclease V [Actinomycetota bacterium]